MYNLNLRFERMAAKGDNFLPCVRDLRALLPPAWQDWQTKGDLAWFILDGIAQRRARRMNFCCPTGSEIRPYRTAPNRL